jgi:hypothetical protein
VPVPAYPSDSLLVPKATGRRIHRHIQTDIFKVTKRPRLHRHVHTLTCESQSHPLEEWNRQKCTSALCTYTFTPYGGLPRQSACGTARCAVNEPRYTTSWVSSERISQVRHRRLHIAIRLQPPDDYWAAVMAYCVHRPPESPSILTDRAAEEVTCMGKHRRQPGDGRPSVAELLLLAALICVTLRACYRRTRR